MVPLGKIACALLLGAATGCTTGNARSGSRTPPPGLPSDQAALAAGLSPEQTTGARQLYLFRCAKCHRFYNPKDYSDVDWEKWMTKMSKKAHLTEQERTELTAYIEVYRKISIN